MFPVTNELDFRENILTLKIHRILADREAENSAFTKVKLLNS